MPLPAIALLEPGCPIQPAWAIFDPVWYLKTYRGVLAADADPVPEAMLRYYLQTGCGLGNSPSPLFDERFYLARNPDVLALVKAGRYRSGFDHYCQKGHRDRSPHWLFDDALYGSLYEDMSLENLDRNHCYGRYDHFLKSGQREGRTAHLMFDGRFYKARAIETGDDENTIDFVGPFMHFIYRLHSDRIELPPSIYFDPVWYAEHHAEAKADIENGSFCSAIHHYLCSETLSGGRRGSLDPVRQFSEHFYRTRYPDVANAVEIGDFRNGYQHFVQLGAFELRRPSPDVDLIYYRDANVRVRNDLNAGIARDAFAHLRTIGLKTGLPYFSPGAQTGISEAAAKQLFVSKARDNLALFGRVKLDFSIGSTPELSVVMVAFDKFELTMLALSSLRGNYAGSIELIIIDNASSDDTRRIEQYVSGAKIFRLLENIGYLRACNLGFKNVTSASVLLLNNDLEFGFGAINGALRRLQSDDKIGAVGGKIIRTHGKLQEAGSIIWSDGSTMGYMRDAAPLAPEANFVRDVDYCSGVFLLARTALVKKLGCFDTDYSPAYYEEVDLCSRMAKAGYRIVYDPAIVIHHLEYGSASNEASRALMQRGRKIFVRKHQAFLQNKLEHSAQNAVFARSTDHSRKRVLFVEDTVPIRRIGSGYIRANDVVHAIVAAGFEVSVFPVNGARYDMMSMVADFPDTVEVLHDRDINGLSELLRDRPDYYHLVWISRTHNLGRVLPILVDAGINPETIPFVLDTEAVATGRDAMRLTLSGEMPGFDFAKALDEEFKFSETCRQIVAVNKSEADLLRGIGLAEVSVLGTIREPDPTPNSFVGREGLLFVAGIHQPDSPNLDSLHWYVDEILPALEAEMENVPVLNFVGYTGPEVDLSAFKNHPKIALHGHAADLWPYYNHNRLFIAPTRFAAGTPYKVYEAASFGLPCVATGLLVEQLGWQDGVEILSAPVVEPKGFAARIAQLYSSELLWKGIRRNALARLAAENTASIFNAGAAVILAAALVKAKRLEKLPGA